MMLKILKALVRIALELRRIREILEIAHKDKLERYEISKVYEKGYKRDSDLEFTAKPPKKPSLYEELTGDID